MTMNGILSFPKYPSGPVVGEDVKTHKSTLRFPSPSSDDAFEEKDDDDEEFKGDDECCAQMSLIEQILVVDFLDLEYKYEC